MYVLRAFMSVEVVYVVEAKRFVILYFEQYVGTKIFTWIAFRGDAIFFLKRFARAFLLHIDGNPDIGRSN